MSCPFYGYSAHPMLRVLASQGGNQCASITDRFAPCRMEMAGQYVDFFEQCEFKGSGVALELAGYERRSLVAQAVPYPD
jgi:hypothetical protein